MNTAVIEPPSEAQVPSTADAPVVAVKRRTIDSVLIGVGIVAAVVLLIAGGLLTWGNRFASNYVEDELSSQNISFPSADALTEEGRTDLVKWADHNVNTGKEAEAYASYINGHLQGIADGQTYADLGGPEREARAAVTAATDAGKPQADVDSLQAKADAITNQRNTLFKGETLRGLLLTAYAWSTIGMIAGIAAIVCFVAAAVLIVLVVLGMIHHHKMPKTT